MGFCLLSLIMRKKILLKEIIFYRFNEHEIQLIFVKTFDIKTSQRFFN